MPQVIDFPQPDREGKPVSDRSDLEDPDYARFAWGRYRKLMGWMALVAVLAIVAAFAWLKSEHDVIPIHMAIATVLGVGLSVMLGAALMGLVFLSAGSGHDDHIQDRSKDDE